jgi:ABC-2 type transport system ATP-binding protein
MIRRRTASVVALVVAVAACDRQPVGPGLSPHRAQPSTEAAPNNGPPASFDFGPDSREIGVNTGQGVEKTGLTCVADNSGRRRCEGYLASDVDATRLDATLDVPPGPGPHPLVVLLHGWAGSKSGESDIAEQLLADGNAVLRYSARGFGRSYGLVNLADIGVEIEDLRSMIGQVVEIDRVAKHPDFALNPDAVAVAGASYGGGQSWLAAVQPVFQRRKAGPTVRIRAIVPIVPWSDLLYSLVPNGHSRSSFDPPGALKFSYVNALYSSGCRNPPTCDNYPTYLRAWHAWLNGTEPAQADPVYTQIRDGLAGYRSIWWQRGFWTNAATNRLPVFLVEGFTDDLFTLEEAKRMLLALETVAPGYPITAYFGDIGHPRARNDSNEVNFALGLIRKWLKTHMNDVRGDEPLPMIHASVSHAGDGFTGDVITVPTYSALATRWLSHAFASAAPVALANPASGAVSGPLTDPVVLAGAATIPAAGELKPYPGLPPIPDLADPTAARFEVPVENLDGGREILIAGQPTISLQLTTTGPRLQLNVRVYDRVGDTKRLITRGTITVEAGLPAVEPIEVRIPTAGNLWQTGPGHVLQFEISSVDAPYTAPSKVASMTTIWSAAARIPIHDRGSSTVAP